MTIKVTALPGFSEGNVERPTREDSATNMLGSPFGVELRKKLEDAGPDGDGSEEESSESGKEEKEESAVSEDDEQQEEHDLKPRPSEGLPFFTGVEAVFSEARSTATAKNPEAHETQVAVLESKELPLVRAQPQQPKHAQLLEEVPKEGSAFAKPVPSSPAEKEAEVEKNMDDVPPRDKAPQRPFTPSGSELEPSSSPSPPELRETPSASQLQPIEVSHEGRSFRIDSGVLPVERGSSSIEIRTGDATVWARVEQVHELVEHMGQNVIQLASSKDKTMVITLIPERLGKLVLAIQEQKGTEVTVELVTESLQVRSLLRAQEHSIGELLLQNGFKLAGFHVGSQSQRSDHHPRGSFFSSQRQKKKNLSEESFNSARTEPQESVGELEQSNGFWFVA